MRVRRLGRTTASVAVIAAAAALIVVVPSTQGTSWAAVAGAFAAVPLLAVVALAVLWMAGLGCNAVALAASLPGLSTRRALTLSLTGSAVANVLPLGGAAGVGLNYAMTRRWGFTKKSFAAYTVTTNVCDVAAKLVVVAGAAAVLLLSGRELFLRQGVVTTLLALIALPVLGGSVLHPRSGAAVGRAIDRVVRAAGGLVGRRPQLDLAQRLPSLSGMTTTLIRRRWRRLTFGTFAYVGLQAALLWACLHVAGLDLGFTGLVAALAVDRLLTLLPLTPGGVGVVEGGMAAALTALGSPAAPVVAGVLLYRCFTYLAEIPVGGLAALIWSFRQRHRAVVSESAESTPGARAR